MNSLNIFFKLSLALVLGTSLVLAQSDAPITGIVTAQPTSTPSTTAPSCATACIQGAVRAQSCPETDTKCLCQRTVAIQGAVSSCLAASSTCTESEEAIAIAFYAQTCAVLGYSISSGASVSASILVATGVAPSKASHGTPSSLVLTATGKSALETTALGYDTEGGHALTTPAILGVTLAVALLVVGIAAVAVWIYLRRRQQRRGQPRMNLDAEFNPPAARPERSRSVQSSFLVQPLPIEKDSAYGFGDPLSRSSTLVASPPAASFKLDKPLPAVTVSASEVNDSFEKFHEREGMKIKMRHGSSETGHDARMSSSTWSMILETPDDTAETDEYDASNQI